MNKRYISRPRIKDFDYTGHWAYHVTFVTAGRRPVLVASLADDVAASLKEAADACGFQILVFTIMPDHLHVLAEGQSDDANVIRFAQRFKQRTSFQYRRAHRSPLWQPSFHDHVMRSDENVADAARYIFNNPVRAGFVADPEDWHHSDGSLVDGARGGDEAPRLLRG